MPCPKIPRLETGKYGTPNQVFWLKKPELPLLATSLVHWWLTCFSVGFFELPTSGLVYDETGKTNDDSIYGAGDVSGLRPIWPVAVKEGIIAASNMVGVARKMTDFFASKSTMNFVGIPSLSLGTVNVDDESYNIEIKDTILYLFYWSVN